MAPLEGNDGCGERKVVVVGEEWPGRHRGARSACFAVSFRNALLDYASCSTLAISLPAASRGDDGEISRYLDFAKFLSYDDLFGS